MSTGRDSDLVVAAGISLVAGAAAGGWAVWEVAERMAARPWAGHLPDRPLAVPLAALLMGVALGFMALVLARHRDRVLWIGTDRGPGKRRALHRGVTRFVGMLGMLGSITLAAASLARMDAAASVVSGTADAFRWTAAAFFLVALGGAVLLVARHGLRRGASPTPAPATTGEDDGGVRLADPACWKLGVFYVAPGDRTVFVEKRVGLGFTLNLGNPRVLLCLALLVVAAAAIV